MATKVWNGAATSVFSTAGNWVGGVAPVTGDAVVIPASATVAIAGSNETATLLIGFTVETGCTITIGSNGTPLQVDADTYSLAGTGQKWISIVNAANTVSVTQSAGTSSGCYGTNLTTTGPAKMVISLASGQTVGISALAGDTASTCTAFAIDGSGTVVIGTGVTKVGGGAPDITATGGTLTTKCAVETVDVTDTAYTHEAGAIGTSLTANRSGAVTYNSTTAAAAIAMKAYSSITYGPAAAKPTAITYVGKPIIINDPFGRTAA